MMKVIKQTDLTNITTILITELYTKLPRFKKEMTSQIVYLNTFGLV